MHHRPLSWRPGAPSFHPPPPFGFGAASPSPPEGSGAPGNAGAWRSSLSGSARTARHAYEACPSRLRGGKAPLGAPLAAISDPGSALPDSRPVCSGPWPMTPHRQPRPWSVQNHWTVSVQRAPRRGVVMPPGRVPGPPGAAVTSRSSRRRIPLRLQNVSGRRPSMSRT